MLNASLTQQSSDELNRILYGNMSPSMVAEYLRQGNVTVRSFASTLKGMYPHDDIVRRLVEQYLAINPSLNRRSVTKKVQNWTCGRNLPNQRDDFYLIAFALSLGIEQLDYLLGIATDYCIQYRDGKELVMAWFLRNGRGLKEALGFYATLPAAQPQATPPANVGAHVTRELHADFLRIHTQDELRNYYVANLDRFGTQHLRAYYYVSRYLAQLQRPDSYVEMEEPSYSLETVMATYLSMHMPSGARRKNMDVVQKLLKQNWPNTTTLKNMLNHSEDVSRKLLLLLYIVTENCGFSESCYDPNDASLEERVRDHWWTLNAMLEDSGMARMDLRNAFDWLIIYAVTSNDDTFMSERLEQVIESLFEAQKSAR